MLLDDIIKQIRKGMLLDSNKDDVTVSSQTMNYLLTNLERYRKIEQEMLNRVRSS